MLSHSARINHACESAHISTESEPRLFSCSASVLKDLSYKGHLRKRLHLSVISEDTLPPLTYVIWSCVEAK